MTPRGNVFLEFCDTDKSSATPYIEVKLTDLHPAENRVLPMPDGTELFDLWDGTLVERLVTTRGVNSDKQSSLLGWLRHITLKILSDADGLQLPSHRVLQVEPGPVPRASDPENMLDFSEIHFNVRVEIISTAIGKASLQQLYSIEEAIETEMVRVLSAAIENAND